MNMKVKRSPVRCYIAAFNNPRIDPVLEREGFSKGMICFAIPDFGVLFRCRTSGAILDLEFGALLSLLEFVKTKLKDEKIKEVQVLSSNPQMVFSFAGKADASEASRLRRRLLGEYSRELKVALSYVKPVENRALVSPAEYPSVPVGKDVHLSVDSDELTKTEFKPFQKGVKIG